MALIVGRAGDYWIPITAGNMRITALHSRALLGIVATGAPNNTLIFKPFYKADRIENPRVAGSIPALGTIFLAPGQPA